LPQEDAETMDFEPIELAEIIEKNGTAASLISVLEEVQAQYRYLPREAMILVSERMGVPLSQVYSVATFYNAFSLERRGRHTICVCQGTACHVRGAFRIRAHLEHKLGIKAGESTPDWNYYLETVNCLGACALGPIVVTDEQYHGQMTERKADQLLLQIEQADQEEV
jgi:NADH-quinone oxidoreductase subunit E